MLSPGLLPQHETANDDAGVVVGGVTEVAGGDPFVEGRQPLVGGVVFGAAHMSRSSSTACEAVENASSASAVDEPADDLAPGVGLEPFLGDP